MRVCELGNGDGSQELGFNCMEKTAAAQPIATLALAKLYIAAHIFLNAKKKAECIRKTSASEH
jgi:hypothetical protein